jgi:predicted DCC family thiol-disulfide oxidoreductase YuxK
MAVEKVTVYYDGLCVLCSREIDHYRKARCANLIDFIDICAPTFDPSASGLDPKAVHRVMHVRRLDGSLATEMDAFIEIWKTLPGYRLLARVASFKFVRFFMNIGYQVFVRIRPYLPRRSADIYACADSPFCEISPPKKTKDDNSKTT